MKIHKNYFHGCILIISEPYQSEVVFIFLYSLDSNIIPLGISYLIFYVTNSYKLFTKWMRHIPLIVIFWAVECWCPNKITWADGLALITTYFNVNFK